MAGPQDEMTQQSIHSHYSEWLEANSLERSGFNGGLFAFRITGFGQAKFEGLSEDEICSIVGGDRYATR